MTSGTPEGYYATVVDAEDFDRYADDERATVHEIRRQS